MEDNSKDRVGYFSHAVDRSDLQPGDHIYVYRRWFYSHHGIYTRDDRVIHLTGQHGWSVPGSIGTKLTATVQVCTLDEFLNGNQLRLVAYGVDLASCVVKKSGSCHLSKSRSADKVLPTAEYYLEYPQEWGPYNVITNNCEHFAYYCKTGTKRSAQLVENVRNMMKSSNSEG